MTPDERVLLTTFLRDLEQARGGPKDAEAEAMISQALARNPDAAYLLVQHTILSDQALQAAQDRIRELEAQAPAQGGGGFLGGGARSYQQSQTSVPQGGGYQAGYGQQPPASPFSPSGGLGSFLRNAGTTAAGVAGGALLFEGLSGLFGGHRGFGFGGGGFGGDGAPVENVTINEYHDDNGGFDNAGDDGNFDNSDWGGGSDDI